MGIFKKFLGKNFYIFCRNFWKNFLKFFSSFFIFWIVSFKDPLSSPSTSIEGLFGMATPKNVFNFSKKLKKFTSKVGIPNFTPMWLAQPKPRVVYLIVYARFHYHQPFDPKRICNFYIFSLILNNIVFLFLYILQISEMIQRDWCVNKVEEKIIKLNRVSRMGTHIHTYQHG